ncbi:MAG: ABC transporter ATP-binding protein, partial [Candidatus Phytoplasma sp.]|nr:ABC transporter ATP-binding protein [Phytoplasma sp.]
MSNKSKSKKGTFMRLLSLVFRENKLKLILVILFMIIATFSNVGAMSTIQNVLDKALEMLETGSTDFTAITTLILIMVGLYSANIIFGYCHLRIMTSVGQDSLLYIRENLFTHMMGLPLKYFDTNKHGDIMSRYTNDVDATRQMISQSLPQLTTSILLMIGYLTAMFLTSWILSIFTLIFSALLILITRIISKRTRKYFIAQQKNVGALNGYIEEMIEGQKVIKVFKHENEAIADFSKLNRQVTDAARISSARSGMLIPITVNMGYLSFAIAAVLGGLLVFNNMLTVPALVAYLLFTRQFTGPVNQMGQQLNSVQMALAGASRIFDVMDLEKEIDQGHVTLVHTTYDENNQLIETKDKTNQWAWKDNDKLTPLTGDVIFQHVN